MTVYNVYAFTPAGDALLIDYDLSEADAVWMCEYEQQHFPAPMERFANGWYEPGMIPRMAFYPADFDPFGRKTGIERVPDWRI